MFLISAISALAGVLLFHLDSRKPAPAPVPTYVERPRPESWDVMVRLYQPSADGRLKEVGGYMLKHSADKASALAEVEARNSQPEALDAEVKAFLLKYEFPPNVLYAVQAQRASGSYSVVSKYKAPISAEEPQ
jgi:hypothetical protein